MKTNKSLAMLRCCSPAGPVRAATAVLLLLWGIAVDSAPCMPGRFRASDGHRCLACPIGKQASTAVGGGDTAACVACPAGKTTEHPGARAGGCTVWKSMSITRCALGSTVSRVFTGYSCAFCPAGKHGAYGSARPGGLPRWTACSLCAPGRSRAARADPALPCALCGAGQYQPRAGEARCKPCLCPRGRFMSSATAAATGASGARRCACSWCPAGKYKPAAGATGCLPCACGAGRN